MHPSWTAPYHTHVETARARAGRVVHTAREVALTILLVAALPGAALAERHTIPLFPPAGPSDAPQGVLRILNGGNKSGAVTIRAIDDAGNRSGPATFALGAWAAAEFDAAELASGSPAKRLSGEVGPLAGDMRLEIETDLDIVPLAYARAVDGTLSAMHDTVPAAVGGGSTGAAGTYRYEVPVFNPASNVTQASRLRLVNPGKAAASVMIAGRDDSGAVAPGGGVRLTLPPGGARTLTATQLEAGGEGLVGRLGAGTGRWRLTVSSDRSLMAVNVAASGTGWHWSNLSSVRRPEPALFGPASTPAPARRHTIPLFAPAGPSPAPQGLLRIVNKANEAGTVEIRAIDDAGARSGPVAFTLNAGAAAEFEAADLVSGNPAKGLSGGIGSLAGDVRLEIVTELDIAALAYARAADGALSAMHDTVSAEADGGAGRYRYDVPMFNPASEAAQASRLRLVNPGDAPASVMIEGRDDLGGVAPGGAVRLTLPAGASRTLTALELEAGGAGLTGRLGVGTGRWRLTVSSNRPLQAVNAVATVAGYLTNLSTVPVTEASVVTPADSFDLRAPNDAQPYGIAHADGRLYVIHWGVTKVYAYRFDGQREPEADFDLIHAPLKIVHANGLFYILDHVTVKNIRAYRADGTHVAAAGFDLHGDNAVPAGIAHANGRFYIVDSDNRDPKVYAYLSSGQRDPSSDFDLHGDNAEPIGIAYSDGRFYIGDSDDDRVYAYRFDGTHDATAGFDLHGDNANHTAITYADGWLYVTDRVDLKVYKYRVDGQPGGGSGGDHGDDAASASRISTDSTTAGSLERGGDKDFFRIELPRIGDLVVETTGNTDTYGELTSADGSVRRTNDDDGEGRNFRISLNDAAPGVYHIEVRGYSASTTGDYNLSVSFTPTTDTRPDFAAGSGPGDQSYTAGAAIAALTLPAAAGGDGALRYTLAPDVPGLSFDAATRRLSGTPSAAGTYAMTYTATDIDGDSATLRFSIAVQASGGGGGVAVDGSFALHGDNRWPLGLAHAAGRFHVVDFLDLKVYAYRADGGGRDESADFDLHGDNGWPSGIAHAGDRFHVLNWSDRTVYAYRADGRRDRSSDFDLHEDNFWPVEIAHAAGQFLVADWLDKKVYAYRADGRRDESSDFDLHSDNRWPVGIAHAGDRIYVVDELYDKVYAYSADGQRDESAEFDLSAGNDDPAGIVHVDGRFHVVDAGDERIYAYPPDGGLRTTCGPGDHDFTLSGVVRDGGGSAVSGATVTVSSVDCDYSHVTGSDGSFDLTFDTATVPRRIAVTVHREGYAPSAFPIDTGSGNALNVRNISLENLGPELVVLELVPEVHHLGDNAFAGSINSGFQRSAEGTEFQRTFSLSAAQAQASSATVTLLAKGLQDQNPLEINGHLIGHLDDSPSDGSYGTVSFPVPMDALQSGVNTLVIESKTSGFDYDDFEFTNVILRFDFGDATDFATGATIPGLPAGTWEPDAISGGAATAGAGGTVIRLDDGGYFEQGGFRYTCRGASGCEVSGGRVRSGSVARAVADTPPGGAPPPGGDNGGAMTYGVGDRIPSLTSGWEPDAISPGGWYRGAPPSGLASVDLNNGSYFDVSGYRYTCRSASGCDLEGNKMNIGVIVRTVTSGETPSSGGDTGWQPGQTFSEGPGPEMVVIPAGLFKMGWVEQPYPSAGLSFFGVMISRSFAVSKYEVTFDEWDVCVEGGGCGGYSPDDRGWGRGNRPVINVSWEDAQAYVSWLSSRTGAEYRLLSESEWEYVARAGSETLFSWGNEIGTNRANCRYRDCGDQWEYTAPVGSFQANAFGVYDMHGNVWEHVEDCWNTENWLARGGPFDGSAWQGELCDSHGNVQRGGGYFSSDVLLESRNREFTGDLSNRSTPFGIRVARTLNP